MRNAARGLDAAVMTINDPGVRAVFTPMVENYRAKLLDVIALWNAVAAGDADAEAQAANDLSSDANAGRAMAADLLDRLRPLMTPEQLDRIGTVTDGN